MQASVRILDHDKLVALEDVFLLSIYTLWLTAFPSENMRLVL